MLRPHRRRGRWTAVAWAGLLLASGVPSGAAAQDAAPGLDTIPESEIDADSIGGLHFGVALNGALVGGEPFDTLSAGVGGSAFVGGVADGRYLIRLRVGGSTHVDLVHEERGTLFTASAEGLVKLGPGGWIRPGLQLGYARLSRGFMLEAGNGTHVGLVVEARTPFAPGLHGRLGLDWVAFGQLQIPELSDPDFAAVGRRATLGLAWIF